MDWYYRPPARTLPAQSTSPLMLFSPSPSFSSSPLFITHHEVSLLLTSVTLPNTFLYHFASIPVPICHPTHTPRPSFFSHLTSSFSPPSSVSFSVSFFLFLASLSLSLCYLILTSSQFFTSFSVFFLLPTNSYKFHSLSLSSLSDTFHSLTGLNKSWNESGWNNLWK